TGASPITTSGTWTVGMVSEAQAMFLASPPTSNGTPTYRIIATTDVPILNQSTSGNAATATSASSANTLISGATVTNLFVGTALNLPFVASGMLKATSGSVGLASANTDFAAPIKVAGGLLSFSTPTLTLNNINLSSQVTGSLPFSSLSSAVTTSQTFTINNGASIVTQGTGTNQATVLGNGGINVVISVPTLSTTTGGILAFSPISNNTVTIQAGHQPFSTFNIYSAGTRTCSFGGSPTYQNTTGYPMLVTIESVNNSAAT